MQLKQIIILGGVTLIMGGLLSLEIHKSGVPAQQNIRNARGGTAVQAAMASGQGGQSGQSFSGGGAAGGGAHGTADSPGIENAIIRSTVQALSDKQKREFGRLDNRVKALEPKASEDLAAFWQKAGRPGLAGIVQFRENAQVTGTTSENSWLKAGDLFRTAIAVLQASESVKSGKTDSLARTRDAAFYAAKAINCYQKALAIDPKSLAAQTGLGVCYVSSSDNPMQGIGLLLGVVKQDPQNIDANFNLGLFSMRSGQYDKAIQRFQTVVRKQNNGEAWFYLAQAYEQKGDKALAVEAYQTSKKYITDQATRASIDQLIQQTIN